MRALVQCLLLWLCWLLCTQAHAQAPRAVQAQRAAAATLWLQQHLYLKESTGYNRDPLIDSWARAVGVSLGSEWCGLTQWACQRALKLPTPSGPAGSYNWFKDPARTYYVQGQRGSLDSIRAGHPLGIYNARRGRIAHITRCISLGRSVRAGRPARAFWCIAGNEGSGANAGVHLTLYPATSIHAAANWLY